MSDNLVASVGRVEPDLTNFSQGLQAQPQATPSGSAKNQPAADAAANTANAQTESSSKNSVELKLEPQKGNGIDVSLRFQVDPDTNDVTILILNNSSRQVVRTIPAEDMNKMEPGEIVQLFA